MPLAIGQPADTRSWRSFACHLFTTALCTTSFHPPFGERSKILNSARASDLAWLPPAVHSNCSEAVCLAAKNLKLFAISLPQQCRDLCQYREVSTRTIAETAEA